MRHGNLNSANKTAIKRGQFSVEDDNNIETTLLYYPVVKLSTFVLEQY